MPNDFDRIEDERDLTAGLEYEDVQDGALYPADDAYELDDPKHERHYETFADYSDMA